MPPPACFLCPLQSSCQSNHCREMKTAHAQILFGAALLAVTVTTFTTVGGIGKAQARPQHPPLPPHCPPPRRHAACESMLYRPQGPPALTCPPLSPLPPSSAGHVPERLPGGVLDARLPGTPLPRLAQPSPPHSPCSAPAHLPPAALTAPSPPCPSLLPSPHAGLCRPDVSCEALDLQVVPDHTV